MDNYTQVEIIKSWLDEHWTDVLKYYGAKMKEASQVEEAQFNRDRIKGVLCAYDHFQRTRTHVLFSRDKKEHG